ETVQNLKCGRKIIQDGEEKLQQWYEFTISTIKQQFEQKKEQLKHIEQQFTIKLDKFKLNNIEKLRRIEHQLQAEQDDKGQDLKIIEENVNKLKKAMETDIINGYLELNLSEIQWNKDPVIFYDSIQTESFTSEPLSIDHLNPSIRSPLGASLDTILVDNSFDEFRQLILYKDHLFKSKQQIEWSHDSIRDIHWSDYLQNYLITTQTKLFTFSPIILQEKCQLEYENANCTCYDRNLFISYDNNHLDHIELPQWTVKTHWILFKDTEYVCQLRCNQTRRIGFIIESMENNERHLELYDWNNNDTLEFVKTCAFYQSNVYGLLYLSNHEWLITSVDHNTLFRLTNNDCLSFRHHPHVINITLLNKQYVIMRTKQSILCKLLIQTI
ncbi:unnamed protein product, partial [Didymodactylos carnosus]